MLQFRFFSFIIALGSRKDQKFFIRIEEYRSLSDIQRKYLDRRCILKYEMAASFSALFCVPVSDISFGSV
jgi:hypothetical protein